MGETPGQHFPHAAVIIGALNPFNPELPVIIPLGASPLIDHHRSHRLEPVCIGNVIGFHADDLIKAQKRGHLFHRSDGPAFLPFDPLPVPEQDQTGILLRQFHQLLFCAFFRHPDSYPLPPFGGQPFLQHFPVFHFRLEHQLPGDKRGSGIILHDKTVQDLRRALPVCDPQVEVISPDQPAAPDKEHLDHRIPLMGSHGQHIPVLPAGVGDLLLLRHLLHAADELPVLDGPLKFQRLGRGIHLLLQILQHRVVIPVQELQHFIHGFSVFFL